MTQKARAMMCPHFLSQGARPSPQNVLRLWNHSISSRNHPYLAYGRKEWKRPEGEGFFGERNWIVMAFPLPLTYESQWDGGGGFLPPVNPKERDLKGTVWRLHGVQSESDTCPRKQKVRDCGHGAEGAEERGRALHFHWWQGQGNGEFSQGLNGPTGGRLPSDTVTGMADMRTVSRTDAGASLVAQW